MTVIVCAFLAVLNGKIKLGKDNKFINKPQKDMEYLKHDPEWRKNYMNLEMKLQDVRDEAAEKAIKKGRIEGIKQEQLNGLKQLQLSLKDLKIPKDAIFNQLKIRYGKYFSDTQIRKYMK